MPRIQIADLQSGTELFQGNESFLTELQSVEASAICGGKGYGRKKGNSSGSKIGSSGKSSSGKSKSSGSSTCPHSPGGGGGIVVIPGGG